MNLHCLKTPKPELHYCICSYDFWSRWQRWWVYLLTFFLCSSLQNEAAKKKGTKTKEGWFLFLFYYSQSTMIRFFIFCPMKIIEKKISMRLIESNLYFYGMRDILPQKQEFSSVNPSCPQIVDFFKNSMWGKGWVNLSKITVYGVDTYVFLVP